MKTLYFLSACIKHLSYRAGKVTAALCHGPAIYALAKDKSGQSLVNGKVSSPQNDFTSFIDRQSESISLDNAGGRDATGLYNFGINK